MANSYKKGDWAVICDKCGRNRYASECRYNWQNQFVCSDTCWEIRHPQDFVHGVEDDQTVPIVRPDIIQSTGETTLSSAAEKNATSVSLSSVSQASDTDSIGIDMDNGATHWTYVNGDPSGTTVYLGSYLPHNASSGNAVYLPSINNETFV